MGKYRDGKGVAPLGVDEERKQATRGKWKRDGSGRAEEELMRIKNRKVDTSEEINDK